MKMTGFLWVILNEHKMHTWGRVHVWQSGCVFLLFQSLKLVHSANKHFTHSLRKLLFDSHHDLRTFHDA